MDLTSGGKGGCSQVCTGVLGSELQIATPGAAAHSRHLEAPGAGLLHKGCRAMLGAGVLGGRLGSEALACSTLCASETRRSPKENKRRTLFYCSDSIVVSQELLMSFAGDVKIFK